MTLYGIPNCDTVKKSRAWFAARGVNLTFHDLRRDGLDAARLTRWLAALGAARLLNRSGATWRKLDPDQQRAADDDATLIPLLLAQPTLIRRPLVEIGDRVTAGFVPETWQALLADGP
ncbi:Spx/MgsR family RNA polymerase-binding regulatory protein [Immundisolibacter sp.]|uniref:Spx/MgsR family RNA polymerase-binding regulatory protein n=1 Tax=Immundisolibacter sp. TaxID=1934948 RepID=UPI002615532F|nr:Spx/MgsR family RNA polymerase-binding regulatory protein [Immundisolibacter sp.]MDD3651158.1 Spx/MgsR family RNA polymerase-binding regulatory protein [Immundisolibacter sp.]